MQQDPALRRLYALINVGAHLIVTFVMYAVIAIEPNIVDAAGGTKLVITAEGLSVCDGACGRVWQSGTPRAVLGGGVAPARSRRAPRWANQKTWGRKLPKTSQTDRPPASGRATGSQ